MEENERGWKSLMSRFSGLSRWNLAPPAAHAHGRSESYATSPFTMSYHPRLSITSPPLPKLYLLNARGGHQYTCQIRWRKASGACERIAERRACFRSLDITRTTIHSTVKTHNPHGVYLAHGCYEHEHCSSLATQVELNDSFDLRPWL